MATIKEVAKAAGVSVATVSRVLNNEQVVALETVERVKAAIEALDYSPNMLGNSLRKSKTDTVLVLLPTLSNQFFSKILRGIEEEAKKYRLNVLIGMTDGDREIEEKYLTMLKTRRVDGAIFFSSTLEGEELTALAKRYPVVQLEYVEGSETSYVSIDNEAAGYEAVSALIRMGHRNIAFLGVKQNIVSSGERKNGYLRALKEAGISPREENIIEDSYSFKSGMRSAEKLWKRADPPTAVFAVADSIAIGLVKGLQKLGCRVPEDISVIGFDNIAVAEFMTPSLSTVSQPQKELGIHAMRLLEKKIQDLNCADKSVVLAHTLILRETVSQP